jgi:hypothetical protein
MFPGSDPEHLRIGIQIQALIRGNGLGCTKLDTPTVLGTGIRMKISQFFASTSKHWLSPEHLPVTVRSKKTDTNIRMDFDLFFA